MRWFTTIDAAARISRRIGLLGLALWLAACSDGMVRPGVAYAAVPGEVTHVRLFQEGGQCARAPVSFGVPFVPGDLAGDEGLHAVHGKTTLPTQVNVKARNPDGSVRHAVVTLQVPCDLDQGTPVALVRGKTAGDETAALRLDDVLDSDFKARVSLAGEQGDWRLNIRDVLEKVSRDGGCSRTTTYCRHWLDGPLAGEWVVGAPPKDANGDPNPRLTVYAAVRAYGPPPVDSVRVDVSVENTWTYGRGPSNVHYAPTIQVGDRVAYHTDTLTHYAHARWHQTLWWGQYERMPIYAALDPDYLQSTPAVPRYEKLRLSSKMKREARQSCPPMNSCGQTRHMGNTGAQAAIGPLARWSAAYVIDPDFRLYRWMLANSDALGAYGVHFRDQHSGEPLSIEDYPCVTTLRPGELESCPKKPGGDQRLPHCQGDCETPLSADPAHHPAPAYVAYLVTGDWYYAQELSFWANWALIWWNPEYRDYARGLIHKTQVRGQAWMLRTLGDAAYLLPDETRSKQHLNAVVKNNIQWYKTHYAENPDANRLGAVTGYHAIIYPTGGEPRTGIAPWQQSFFMWAIGNLDDQGFPDAGVLRNWFARYQVATMTNSEYCWELASAYKVKIREKKSTPVYKTFKQVYRKSFPKLVSTGCEPKALNRAIKKKKGRKRFHYPPKTMVGYPESATGFPANFQVGLAAAAISSDPGSRQAWSIFASRNTKPDYSSSPQFAVIPTDGRHSP